jgi:glycosyltransferase involved in cell wall biosynthesis
MIKIVITANTSWYLYNFRKNTITSLIDAGYNVIAVAPSDEYSNKLLNLGCNFVDISIDKGGTNPINDLKTLISFYNILKKEKPKVVLNFTPKNNIYSTIAASYLNIAVINNIAGLGILFINESISSKIAQILYKYSQKKANKIFFQNEDDRSLFLNKSLAPEDITERLPGSGVDLSRFSLHEAKDDGVVKFLLVARMLFDKGIEHYVEGARLLRSKYGNKVKFSLLGFLDVDNPSAVTKIQMDKWVAEGVISYLGVSDTVEQEIAKVDCMVLPSFYREGVPKSLLEAGAMAKPIVTTDNVGCRETVDDGVNGFLCDIRSTSSLVDKLELIIGMSHEQRVAMGRKSRIKIAKEFDESIVIDKYLSAVVTCIKKQ